MKAKDGLLKMAWNKRTEDVMYTWGNGVEKIDAALIHAILTTPSNFLGKALIQELIKRGYDITTIKFSIQKKKV